MPASLQQGRCAACGGTGELRIDSENINENFEVEKQTVITPCMRCSGSGFTAAGLELRCFLTEQERERQHRL